MTPRPDALRAQSARRRRIALLPAAMCLAAPASAWNFGIPRLEDLGPKWDVLSVGQTPEEVVRVMGSPQGRTETVTAGISHLTLTWKDVGGHHYTARFVAGRLYVKQLFRPL